MMTRAQLQAFWVACGGWLCGSDAWFLLILFWRSKLQLIWNDCK